MGKFLDIFKSFLGRRPREAPKRVQREYPPFTKDFSINPESSFAVKMFQAVIQTANTPDANIVVSPYSAEVILAAILPGAGGELKSALTELLCQAGRDFSEIIRNLEAVNTDGALKSVNAAFYDDRCCLAPQYQETIQSAMQFGFSKTPFEKSPGEALTIVNNFVAEKTEGKIISLLSEVKPTTLLILVNIIDFSGQWEIPFDKKDTELDIFYCPKGVEKTVEFMKNNETWVRASNMDASGEPKMVILNVANRKFSVMLILPAENTGGISDLEKELTIEKLLALRERSSDGIHYVVMPKFRISCGVDLIPGAKAMGLQEMFEPSVTNFSGMFEDTHWPKQVDVFRQEVVLEVDEYGVKAAAATGCCIGDYCCDCSRSSPDFVANRPFLVIIWNEVANVPVFIGRITDPS
ncbi:serpin B8-like [Paramacrobiotus metropolitanus]|uniref:serpin B8-like n=1 Tax=Paramacrobiotus metropolitanus TaxID=2943436 RepID=UPI0024458506|nr:serpin B8-like [Paramacrobiotus metropolitanus]